MNNFDKIYAQIEKDSNDFNYNNVLTKMEIIRLTDFNVNNNLLKVQIENNKINILSYPNTS